MREIKFRAWDKRNGCWLTDKDNVYLNEEGSAFILVRGAATDYISRVDVDIVFFTGLKDKNGTEIYEGDIFGESIVGLEDEYTGYVKYDEDIGSFVVVLPNGGWEYLGSFVTLSNHSRSKVIGNKYENPELIS